MTIDISQQRCGHDGCHAWRLSRLGTAGQQWKPCWLCKTADAPTGPRPASEPRTRPA